MLKVLLMMSDTQGKYVIPTTYTFAVLTFYVYVIEKSTISLKSNHTHLDKTMML